MKEKDEFEHIDEQLQKLLIQRQQLLQKALRSDDHNQIYKAQKYIAKINQTSQSQQKSILLDSSYLSNMDRYEKPSAISWEMLRAVSRIPIIKAIIETRVEQVSNFLQIPEDKYSTGFIIRKKRTGSKIGEEKTTKEEEKEIDTIIEFLLKKGFGDGHYTDSFYTFTRKLIFDSLVFDQMTCEKLWTRASELTKLIPVDGSTIRLANEEEMRKRAKAIRGQYPKFVQVVNGVSVAEFYPFELAVGIRNVSTDIRRFGYGRSELEDLVQTITNILNAEMYNANYFRIGSNPKGIIRVSGNVNQARIEELKATWQAEVSGVMNAHKTPVLEADKIDFINTQSSNKDMEYSKYYEFLIKLTCAVYKIDPSEIGFTLNGSADVKPMFEGNNESRIKYSRDKGLKPLLRFYQSFLNTHIISEMFDGKYELRFVGIDARTYDQELELDIKASQAGFVSQEDMFKKYTGRDFDPNKDTILNPVFLQHQQMKMMGGAESNQFIEEEYGEEDNPFMKSLESDINKILQEPIDA